MRWQPPHGAWVRRSVGACALALMAGAGPQNVRAQEEPPPPAGTEAERRPEEAARPSAPTDAPGPAPDSTADRSTDGARPPYGPLAWEEGSPLQRVTLTPMAELADPVDPGAWQADLWLGYSNIFEQDSAATHVLFLDLERLITAATVRYGVGRRLEVGARFTLETTGGGVLDSFISWWHGRLGLGNANRGRYPENAYAQRLVDGRGDVRLDAPSRTLALEDVRLFAKWGAWTSADGRRALSLRGLVRLPTQDNGVTRERTDVSLMVLARSRWGRAHIHGMMGLSTLRTSREVVPVLRDAHAFLNVAGEYPLAGWVSAVVQYSLSSAAAQGFRNSELDSPLGNVVFGAAGRVGSGWRWDVSFQEDIPADTPAVDFTLGVRVSRIW